MESRGTINLEKKTIIHMNKLKYDLGFKTMQELVNYLLEDNSSENQKGSGKK